MNQKSEQSAKRPSKVLGMVKPVTVVAAGKQSVHGDKPHPRSVIVPKQIGGSHE